MHIERPMAPAALRVVLVLTALAVVAVQARTWGWVALIAVPLVVNVLAVRSFRDEVLQRWLASGYLLAADLLLLCLALLGTGQPRPLALAGLFTIVLIASVQRDRVRTLLAGGAALGLLTCAAAANLAPGLALTAQDLVLFPFFGAAALHFGRLAEFLNRGAGALEASSGERNELWALLDITDTITSSLDVTRVMHAIVERVGDLVDAPSCSVLLADNTSRDCYVVASKGHPEARMMELALERYPEVRQAIATRQPVVVDDVATDPLVDPSRDVLLAQGYRSMLVLPLLFGEEVVGALFLKSRRHGRFDADVQRFCRVVACVSANALKNAMLYREVTREAARHRETGEKLRRVLDATPDMIVATDPEGVVTEFNRGAVTLTGHDAEWAIGRRLSQVLQSDVAPDGEAASRDVAFERRDGGKVEVSLVSAALTSAADEPAGHVWIGRDVTKLRRVERRLVQAERLSSLGEIVAGVAHELNNPLSAVVGYAELLRSNASDPEQIGDLQRIVESAMRCQRIVFKLLSFARKHKSEKRHQSLNECVSKVLDLKSYQLRSSQVETVLELDEALPQTSFDFHQLEQVVLNLLNNAEQAISAVGRGGRIVLRTRLREGMLCLEVQDSGPGVPRDVRDRIFDPFFTTKAIGQGTGLGLSVSYGIVAEHGGRIELAEGLPGEGACFRILLPVVEAADEPAASREPEPLARAGSLRGRRILVAEDEPMVLELFARLLRREGALVTLAGGGQEAWERLCGEDFDLVVVDLRMPDVSGQQLYEKAAEERPQLLRRFVFATGDLARAESVAFLKGLPNRILAKPLEVETVRRVLSQALDAAA